MMFHKETEFQETEIGEFPKDWKVVKLKDILILLKNGLTLRQRKDGKGYPVTRIETISEEKIDPTKLGYVTGLSEKDIEEYRLIEGDILFSHINSLDHIGKTAIYEGEPELLLHGMNLLLLRPNKNIVHPRFLLYLLRLSRARKIFSTMAKKAVNQASINQTELGNLKIPLPPLEEQKRIADILSMIDSGIETVDRAIAKLERMKRVLMNKLLTGRIRVREENGKLTFYKETEFQDAEIGKIPKDWKTKKLSSLATIIMGQSPPSSTYNKEGKGLPFIQGKMEFGKMYPSPTTYTSRPLKIAEKGDVLMSVRAPVGDVNIAPYKLCIGRGLAAIRFNSKTANNLFYFYYLQSIKSRLESLGKGSTFKAITKKDLQELRIVYLPLNERKGIANILLTIDDAIELYYREKEKLLRLRRGLMSVLLTGRVRVVSDVRDVGVVV